jgi:hypothetical protein
LLLVFKTAHTSSENIIRVADQLLFLDHSLEELECKLPSFLDVIENFLLKDEKISMDPDTPVIDGLELVAVILTGLSRNQNRRRSGVISEDASRLSYSSTFTRKHSERT